jgi:hypothetical protein
MFQSWRLKLREAEEALRAGRLDDARKVLAGGELQQYLPGQRLTEKLVQGFVERALRKGLAGDPLSGWSDLEAVRSMAGESDAFLNAREELFAHFLADIESRLVAEDAAGALSQLERLERKQISAKPLKILRDVARRLESARNLARRGRFLEADEQLQSAAALRPDLAFIETRRAALRQKLETNRKLIEDLHRAMAQPDWSRALTLADELLEIAPEHAVAQEARRRAWAEVNARIERSRPHLSAYNRQPYEESQHDKPLAPIGFPQPANGTPQKDNCLDLLGQRAFQPLIRVESPAAQEALATGSPVLGPAPQKEAAPPVDDSECLAAATLDVPAEVAGALPDSRFLLWVDGVGGYLVCMNSDTLIGQAVPATTVDLPILGDLSRRHAWIRRQGERYLLEPCRISVPAGSPQARTAGGNSMPAPVRINRRPICEPTLLYDQDEIELGSGVKLRFAQPHALSATARLDFLSRHRPQLRVDGVLLMAESCVLGPNFRNHVVCRDWKDDVVLYRHSGKLYCRAMDDIEIDGRLCEGRGELTAQSVVKGDDFSLALENVRLL